MNIGEKVEDKKAFEGIFKNGTYLDECMIVHESHTLDNYYMTSEIVSSLLLSFLIMNNM